eukprot:12292161-Karenia_brevis.AAC.1
MTTECSKTFHSQGLENTVWVCAKAGHASLTCFDAIVHEVKARLKDLGSQQLANTVWAFATLGC